MRTRKDNGKPLPRKGLQIVDWKDNPEAVLKAVDRQLRAHGLEVVIAEAMNDSYEWWIEPRTAKRKKK